MNKTISLLALLLALPILSGCGIGDSVSEKMGEKIAEEMLEAGTGQKVDIDSAGGSMTVENENGKTEISTGDDISLPDGFPEELLIAKDAKITVATALEKSKSVSLTSNEEPAAIYEKYKAEMPGLGWTKDTEMDTGDIKMLTFNKGTEKFSATISVNTGSDEGRSMVTLILNQE